MRKRLEEKYLERMALVLRELSRRSLSRREMQSKFLQKVDSPSAFEGTILFLIRDGRIRKSGTEYRAPYVITDRGKLLLEALS